MKTKLLFQATLMAAGMTSLALAQPAPPPQGGPPPKGGPPPAGAPPGGGAPKGGRPAGPQQQRPAQRPRPNHQPMQRNMGPPRAADPLPNLPDDLMIAFADGRKEFRNVENAAGGLGPIFNRNSCVACHFQAGIGGASNINVMRFGRTTNGIFDPLLLLGGSLLQQRAINPAAREFIPPVANIVARRQTTPLFGIGLIEAIADQTILNGVHDGKPDGVLGRAAMITDVTTGDTRVGRFGWKAQQATLLAFSADAYLNEMGVTNRFFPTENAPNGNATLLAQHDAVADPEDSIDPATGKADIDHSADFMRLLAPLPTLPLSPSASAGQALFQSTGCAVCHTPSMLTDTNAIDALSEKTVDLYSDLLLHDMGSLGDGIAQADAGPREMKTPPLWGLRASRPYLHDGRATSVDAAIRAHAGEAVASKDRYQTLSTLQRQQLLDFLNSL